MLPNEPSRVAWIESDPYYGECRYEGWVAEMVESPLTGKARLRIVDFLSEARDPEAGIWKDASDCIDLDSI